MEFQLLADREYNPDEHQFSDSTEELKAECSEKAHTVAYALAEGKPHHRYAEDWERLSALTDALRESGVETSIRYDGSAAIVEYDS